MSELKIVNFNSFLFAYFYFYFYLFFILGTRIRVSITLHITITKKSYDHISQKNIVKGPKTKSYSIFYIY